MFSYSLHVSHILSFSLCVWCYCLCVVFLVFFFFIAEEGRDGVDMDRR